MTMTWMTLCIACVLFVVCVAAPTRRQYLPETSSSGPAVVTGESEVWDASDDFDLDGDEDWLGESAASPSSIPVRQDYDEYDDDSSNDDDDVEHQDAEEDDVGQDAARSHPEFLFVPSSDSRLMLQDDDADQSGLIKVRHTGKNGYSEVSSNSLDEESKDEDDDQFEFTLGEDDKDDENDLEKDDFVLEDDAQPKDIAEEQMPRRMSHYDEEQVPRRGSPDDDSDDDAEDDDDEDDPAVFESPEEDSQVIYGDHVFLY